MKNSKHFSWTIWLLIASISSFVSISSNVSAEQPPLSTPLPPEKIVLRIQGWYKEIHPSQNKKATFSDLSMWVRAYLASRWNGKSNPDVIKNWEKFAEDLATWDGKKAFKKYKNKEFQTQLSLRLRGNSLRYMLQKSAPEPSLGRGSFQFRMKKWKRQEGAKERMYQLDLHGTLALPRLKEDKLDATLLRILGDLASIQGTNIPSSGLFAMIPTGTFSRTLADYLSVPFSKTAHFLDKYMVINRIAEKKPKSSLFDFQLQAQWNQERLLKDFPFLKKDFKRKYNLQLQTVFADRWERPWAEWKYNRNDRTHRVKALISSQGFHTYNEKAKNLSKPWRPTKGLKSEFRSIHSFSYSSSLIQIALSQMKLRWVISTIPQGVQLKLDLLQTPQIKIQGGLLLRLLARLAIPGGIEGLMRRVFKSLQKDARQGGLQIVLQWKNQKRLSIIHTKVLFPMYQERSLTSSLRISRYLTGGRRKNRNQRRALLWREFFKSIHRDLLKLASISPLSYPPILKQGAKGR